jgi:signal transduction histidine kinase
MPVISPDALARLPAETLDALLDVLETGVVIYQPTGEVRASNHSLLSLLGLERPPRHRCEVLEALSRAAIHPDLARALAQRPCDAPVETMLELRQGVLRCYRSPHSAGAKDGSEIEFYSQYSDQARVLSQNAALIEEARRRADRLQSVTLVAETITSSLNLGATLAAVLLQVAELAAADAVAVGRVSPDGGLEWLEHLSRNRGPTPFATNLADATIARRLRESELVALSTDAARTPLTRLAAHAGFGHLLILPLAHALAGEGALVTAYRELPDADETGDLLRAVAPHVAAAVSNSLLYEAERASRAALELRNRRVQALNRMVEAAASTLVLDAALTLVARELATEVSARAVAIYTADGPLVTVAGIHDPHQRLGLSHGEEIPLDRAPELRAMISGQAAAQSRLSGDRSIYVPITVRDQRIGAVAVLWPGEAHPPTADDLEFVRSVADHIGLATENARVVRDLAMTRETVMRMERARALGELAGGVAHEVGNLLQLIRVHASADQDPADALQRIARLTGDAADILRRIQTFGRPETDPDPVEVDIDAVVTDALALAEPLWRNAVVEYTVSVRCGSGSVVLAHPGPLQEVVLNLVYNALHAMPGGGRLEVRCWADSASAYITVADTGCGIPEELREKVFRPFFSTKGSAGTGLGLSIARTIIDGYGGELGLESRVGVGSAFSIVLPRAGAVSSDGGVQEAPSPPATAIVPRRILIVDDEPTLRAVLRDLLAQAGHEVTEAESGRVALENLSTRAPDVLITDQDMPGMSGVELTRQARAAYPNLPIVVLSGVIDADQQEALRSAGASELLLKPISAEDLAAAVARVSEKGD